MLFIRFFEAFAVRAKIDAAAGLLAGLIDFDVPSGVRTTRIISFLLLSS